jgi:hypothetical protein
VQGIVVGMAYLQKNGIRNECLRLQTICVSQTGCIKIADPSITSADSNYKLCQIYPGLFFPLSPNQACTLSGSRSRQSVGNIKDDVFCGGIVVLELALIGTQHTFHPAGQIDKYKASITQGM